MYQFDDELDDFVIHMSDHPERDLMPVVSAHIKKDGRLYLIISYGGSRNYLWHHSERVFIEGYRNGPTMEHVIEIL
jgi:hypothetical protein